MDGYYKIILLIAIISYVILMTIIVVLMTRSGGQSFPPQQSLCPDYWQLGSGSQCIVPNQGSQNSAKLYQQGVLTIPKGTPGASQNTIDFNDAGWTTLDKNKTVLCNKNNWANSNGIMWSGVSNTNTC